MKVQKSERMGDLRLNFCTDYRMKSSNVKFVIDGQRIHDDETANTLGLVNGDVIEIFTEMLGGGWPHKKNIYGDLNKIRDILDKDCNESLDLSADESDLEDLDSTNLKEHVDKSVKPKCHNLDTPISKIQQCKEGQDRIESNIENRETNENTNEETTDMNLARQENDDIDTDSIASSDENETSNKIWSEKEHNETNEDSLLEDLRKDYEDGKLRLSSSFDMKIIHFLKLPTLAPVELKMLRNIVEQKAVHRIWANEKDQLFPNVSKKRKFIDINDKPQSHLRDSRRTKTLKFTEKNDTKAGDSVKETMDKDNKSNTETPRKREILFRKFEIKTPSPIVKLAKVTEEEMKRISIAVHLYAEVKFGSTKSLQKVRLKEKDFKNILEFAGPGSRYNLIKGRSAIQYKCIWRNSAKSKNSFRGHPESGFEDNMKVHNASIQFCPFEHCSTGIQQSMNPLETDLALLTPKRIPKTRSIQSAAQNTSRQLFVKDKQGSLNRKYLDKEVETVQDDIENNTLGQSFDQTSPTKEDLTNKKIKLLQEIKLVTEKLGKHGQKERESQSNKINFVKCKIEECNKKFTSALGLIKHQKKYHAEVDIQKKLEICSICGKGVIYIDTHLRTVHKDILGEETCDICMKKVQKTNMKNHRGECIYCPSCGKKEKKKHRLLKHIENCRQVLTRDPEQQQPLDLTSPMKKIRDKKDKEQTIKILSTRNQDNIEIIDEREKPTILQLELSDASAKKGKENRNNRNEATETMDNVFDGNQPLLLDPSNIEDSVDKKRTKFPFDRDDAEEYMSEFEDNDEEQYTRTRRLNKDSLERRLREIDSLQNSAQAGDEVIVKQFKSFMQTTTNGENKEGQFSQSIEPSTVGIYTREVQNNILKAFHQLFRPFDSRWLLDCTTVKECTFEGEERVFVSPNEPIYLTARVLRKALEKYNSVETGQQRAVLVAATRQFMHFIELHFNNKLNLYGREPLEKVISYHNGVKSFIDSTKIWKTCNKDKKKKLKNNKVLKEYENPNYEAEILEKYQKYLKSPIRMSQIKKILKFATEGANNPSAKEMTELGKIAMGEIITSTGCRPVVVYRLTVGAWVGKKPGFNPREVEPGDCIVDEEQDEMKIYRRLNPSLPPKKFACKHQLEYKTATCPENCDDRCDPQGFNIHVDWDKTRDTKGSSYLHIAKPIKDILDLYDIIKTEFFKGRRPDKTLGENWLDNENTSFFLNSSGSPYQAVDLKHLSDDMGIDVTAYSFRQIISTWALSHDSLDIRKAEGEALQHSVRVAFDHYVQNKQLQPQMLTQTYIEQECILPDNLREEIKKTEIKAREKIAETEISRQKKQHKLMLQESQANKEVQRENRPLGPRHRVLGVDRNKFKEIIEDITSENIENTLKQRKPLKWRNFIVRTVSASTGERGNQLRDLWLKIYRGDLQWGVRDMRFRAKETNWPRRDSNAYLQKKDRNSWIASSILKSLQTDAKVKEKNNYVKSVQKIKV